MDRHRGRILDLQRRNQSLRAQQWADKETKSLEKARAVEDTKRYTDSVSNLIIIINNI